MRNTNEFRTLAKDEIAKLEKDVIVRILEKRDAWVKVDINKIKGWIPKENLWGVNDDSE